MTSHIDEKQYRDQQVTVRQTADAAQAAWSRLDPNDLAGSWSAEVAPRAVQAVSAGQRQAASRAQQYVIAVLVSSGVTAAPVGALITSAFAGVATNGLPLDALLRFALSAVLRAIKLGAPVNDAQAFGLRRLLLYATTEVADAGRVATQVASLTEPAVIGYERVVHLPACGHASSSLVVSIATQPRSNGTALRLPDAAGDPRPVARRRSRQRTARDVRSNEP